METENKFYDYDKLKGNPEGTIAAIVIAGVTAIGTLCKYAIDAVKNNASK